MWSLGHPRDGIRYRINTMCVKNVRIRKTYTADNFSNEVLLVYHWKHERDNIIGRRERDAAEKRERSDDLRAHVDQL